MQRFIILAIIVATLGLAAADDDIGLELTLVNSLHYGPGPDAQSPNLMMDLERRGGAWERVWANARNYNVSIHWGRVTTGTVSSDAISLALAMRIEGDSWVQGGRASYRISLTRDANGTLEGTYQGRYRDVDFTGRAFGRVKPPVPPREGFVAFAPGEHPRILFRQSDIPRLRRAITTPFGRAAFAALPTDVAADKPNAIGLGIRYQLSGDAAFAEKCRQAVAWHMNDTSVPAFARGRQWGARLEQVAIGYDLCCDAWPQDFRKQVAGYLRFTCATVFNDPQKLGRSINWRVGSNYAGPIYAGVAFAGLALLGEPGPEPTPPQAPSAVPVIKPADGYVPPPGVPVVPVPIGGAAKEWLAASVGFGMSNDPMDGGLAEWADLRPAPGDTITIDDSKATFAVLGAKDVMNDPAEPKRGGINLKSGHLAPGKTFTLLGYHVLKVEAPAQLKLRAPFSKSGRVQVMLNGHPVANGQVIGVEPGLYPFLVCLRLPTNLWGSLEPWFEPATDADLAASAKALAAAEADHAERVKDWEFDLARWKENGNRDVQFEKINEMGRRMMYLFCREACGDGGYQTESGHYFEDAIDGPARYAHAYWTAMGRPLSTFDDITAFVPRKLMAKILLPTGSGAKEGFIEQKINHSYGEANVLRTLAELYPQIDARWRPALLWHWNREWGGDPLKPDLARLAARNPVYTLLNYPVDEAGTAPGAPVTAPGEVMPLTWAADGFGYYICRNGWKGPADDIVVQMFGKAKGSQGWGGADCSTFRIWGMGSEWAGGNTDREARRWLENVVAMPEDDLTESACGRILQRTLRPDGSGTVTIDASQQFYRKLPKNPPPGSPTNPRDEAYGGYAHPGTATPVATDPIRAFAVDYSGASGAPMLFSVLDRIDGGGLKEWYWQVDPKRVAVEAGGFTISGVDGCSLRVTFITPQEPVLVATSEARKTTKSAGNSAGRTIQRQVDAVRASGKDPKDGRFWAVATLAKGEHPAVKVAGSGLEATVTVGGQVLTFDGTSLHLAK